MRVIKLEDEDFEGLRAVVEMLLTRGQIQGIFARPLVNIQDLLNEVDKEGEKE